MEKLFGEDINDDPQQPEETVVETESDKEPKPPRKQSGWLSPDAWKLWLETDEAIRTVYLIFGLLVITLLMILLQFSTQAICCGDWDGYYHIRWSAELWENIKSFKFLPSFRWLPLTTLNPVDYADHHFLFHLMQIPFLWFFGPVMAAKIAAVFYGSLAIFSVYWLIFRYKVDYMLVWLFALLTCSNPFFYRMNMAKAPPLTIIISVIGIYLLFERKYIWLMPLMFVFVWTYSLFPLLMIAAVIWVAIIGWNEKKFEWRPLAYTFAGMVLGNVINPYFPKNIELFFAHFIMKVRSSYEVAVGGEWYPYDGWQLLTHLTVALAAMLIGYILFKPKGRTLPEKATFFLVFGTLLLAWMFKSKRLAEYFPPFAILFCAFSWQAFTKPHVPQLPDDFIRDIEPLLDAEPVRETQTFGDYAKIVLPWATGTLLVVLFIFNVAGTKLLFGLKGEDLLTSIQKNQKDDRYGEAMEWAVKNIPPGQRIFNCNWDDFPKLFFFNTRHSYVWGLDPNYLYAKDPELYKTLKAITDGTDEDPAPKIKELFGANWVFTDAKECEDMVAKLLESGWAETVHEDGEAFILKLRDQKGDPPPTKDVKLTKEEEERLAQEEANDRNNDGNNANLPEDDEFEEYDDEDPVEEDLPPEDEEPAPDESP